MSEKLGNIIKLWEMLKKHGIGSLASPEQIKLKGMAHAEVRYREKLMMAQAEKDTQDIIQGKKQYLIDGDIGKLIDLSDSDDKTTDMLEPKTTINDFSRKIEQQKHAEEIQQEININKTIHLVEEELLKSQQEPSEKEIDSDWLYRWRDNAKNITNDELRQFWARALAGEVKSPGSYSLRTLEFIKNLSQEEAQSIAKLGSFATFSNAIFKMPVLEKEGINFAFLLQMEELGILIGVQSSSTEGVQLGMKSVEQSKYLQVIISRNRILIIEAEEASKPLALDCYSISKVGAELFSLGDFSANEEYMREIGEQIKSKGFDVKIADYVKTHVGGIEYSNPVPL